MVARGFNILDLLIKPQLILNIQLFKGSRTALTKVVKMQRISGITMSIALAG